MGWVGPVPPTREVVQQVRRDSPHVAFATWTGAFVLAAVVGLYTKPADSAIALFWPAAGVAVSWLLASRTAPARAGVLLVVASVLVVQATVVYDGVAAVLLVAAAHVVLAGGCAALLHRLALSEAGPEDPWGPLRSAHGLMAVIVSAAAASLGTSPLIAAAVVASGGAWSWETPLAWTGRNAVAVVLVTVTVVAVCSDGRSTLAVRDRVRAPRPSRSGLGARVGGSVPELGLLLLATATALVVVFQVAPGLPLVFVLVAVVAWAGARFAVETAALHVLATSMAVIAATALGVGPFAEVTDPLMRALVAQLFVGLCFCLALTLALGEERHERLATRLRASEAEARAQADLLATVTASMTDALVVLGADGRVVLANQAARSLLGGSTVVALDDPARHGFFLLDGTPIPTEDGLHTRALRGETVAGELVQHVAADSGERRFLSVGAAPLPGSQPSAVFLLRDVTREQMHLRQVQGFAGMVAHDLKSPLAALTGWHQMLDEELDALGAPAATAAGMNDRIGSSTRRMARLIDDLLGYARAQAAEHHPEPVDLDAVVGEVLADRPDLGPGAVTCATGAVLHADTVQLRQVMANLVGNALKYVAPGTTPRVRISARTTHGWDEVVVDDNGVGIPAGQHEAVFDPFVRMHTGYEGTGLGLAICRTVADKHGGSLTARTGPEGVGTRMVLRLPSGGPGVGPGVGPGTERPSARPASDRVVPGALRPVGSAERG